ncbi:hypothetical protein Y1Q_0019406 [Alligator mississippiensis]|uniref:Uncharacterized protein n=1 Tax=Alligator mississippiensis TaxID=8496 RepID=A0A151MRA7_ALLMI|nr:hypothetical protein Y1Q_0019406 [Alligator mississippiensis]
MGGPKKRTYLAKPRHTLTLGKVKETELSVEPRISTPARNEGGDKNTALGNRKQDHIEMVLQDGHLLCFFFLYLIRLDRQLWTDGRCSIIKVAGLYHKTVTGILKIEK